MSGRSVVSRFALRPGPFRRVLAALFLIGAGTSAWAGIVRDVGFFDTARPADGTPLPDVSLALDREEYDPMDVTGVAVVQLRPLPAGSAARSDKVSVRLELLQDGKPLQTETISPVRKDNIDVTLDTASVPIGAYTLRAVLVDEGGREQASAERALRKRVKRTQATEPQAARIPLSVWGMEKAGGESYPVCTGVPFPQGALNSPDHVRLVDDKGKETPCQVSVRSLWNRGGSIQWLGLDFPAAIGDKGTRYFLEYGRAVTRQAPVAPISVAESAAGFAVDTGALRFTIRKHGFNLIDEAYLRSPSGTEIPAARQDAASGLVVEDHEGTVYRAANDGRIDVRIEEQGPFKVVIRAEGWYVKDDAKGGSTGAQLPTDRLCRHITRLTAWAGMPYVQVDHVWIVTFDSRKVRIRNIGIGLKAAEAEKVALALDGTLAEYKAAEYPSVRLYQRACSVAELETDGPELRRYGGPKTWQAFGDDAKTLSKVASLRSPGAEAGWATVAGKNAGVTVFIRDLRQLYPKEIECADGRLWAHVWPRHGRPFYAVAPASAPEIYKLWWCHEGRELDFQTPQHIFDALTEYANNPGYSWAGMFANAMGVGVQTQVLFWFHPAGVKKEEVAKMHGLFQLEPDAQPEPQWTCDSLALGRIFPRDDKTFPEVERYLEAAFKRNCFLMDRAGDYGMLNYRDYHNGSYYQYADGKWAWGTYRVWESTHYNIPRSILQMYVRTADPFYLQEARRNVRHLMNVDVVQYDDEKADLFKDWKLYAPREWYTHRLGAAYHAKGFVHWGGDLAVDNHYSNFDGIYLHYLMNGSRRAKEVVDLWATELRKLGVGRLDVTRRSGHAPAFSLLTWFMNTQDAGALVVLEDFRARMVANFKDLNALAITFAPFLAEHIDYSGAETVWAALTSPKGAELVGAIDGGLGGLYAAEAYTARRDERYLVPGLAEQVFTASARWDTRGWQAEPRDAGFTSYHDWGYAVRYWLPYLKVLREKGLGIEAPAAMKSQAYPPYSWVCFRKEAGKPVRLMNDVTDDFRRGRKAAAADIAVRVVDKPGPVGKTLRTAKVSPTAKPGEGEELASARDAEGIYYAAVGVSSPHVLLPVTDAKEMVVLPKGAQVRFTRGIWYFRTAPDQRELTLALRWSRTQDPGNLSFQVRSGDRKQLLASCIDSEDMRLPVQPDTLYCILCWNCALTSPDRDLCVAARPQDLFKTGD